MSQDDAHRQEKQEHKGMQLVVRENVDLQLDHVNVTSVAFHSDPDMCQASPRAHLSFMDSDYPPPFGLGPNITQPFQNGFSIRVVKPFQFSDVFSPRPWKLRL